MNDSEYDMKEAMEEHCIAETTLRKAQDDLRYAEEKLVKAIVKAGYFQALRPNVSLLRRMMR